MIQTKNAWRIESLLHLDSNGTPLASSTTSPFSNNATASPFGDGSTAPFEAPPVVAANGQRMSDADYERIIERLEEALQVFRSYDGRLGVRDIRLQSLITVLRTEVTEAFARTKLQAES